MGISPADTVVDMGCGTGSFARAVADHGASVIAIDPSIPMLEYCEAHNRSGDRLRCQRAGFLTFDLPPDSANSGWSQDDLAAHIREEYSTYSWILQGILERAGFGVSVENPTTEYSEFTCRKPT